MNASTYTFDSTAEIQLTRLMGIPKLGTPRIKLKGPTTIRRSESTSPAPGRFRAETTITKLNLSGKIMGAAVNITLNKSFLSKGAIEGRADPKSKNPGKPEPIGALKSYFDIYVDITTPVGTAFNKEPVRMQAQIRQVPPSWARYKQYSPPRTLFDKVIGSIIADALHATHVVKLVNVRSGNGGGA